MNQGLITVILLLLLSKNCFSQFNYLAAAAENFPAPVENDNRQRANSSSIVHRDPPQLPRSLVNYLQGLTTRVYKMYSIYQPEVTGLICLLKYYKLFNLIRLPGVLPDYFSSILDNYLGNTESETTTTSTSGRTFFLLSVDPDYKEKQFTKLTLWHCGKVYLFSFFVRALEIFYFR